MAAFMRLPPTPSSSPQESPSSARMIDRNIKKSAISGFSGIPTHWSPMKPSPVVSGTHSVKKARCGDSSKASSLVGMDQPAKSNVRDIVKWLETTKSSDGSGRAVKSLSDRVGRDAVEDDKIGDVTEDCDGLGVKVARPDAVVVQEDQTSAETNGEPKTRLEELMDDMAQCDPDADPSAVVTHGRLQFARNRASEQSPVDVAKDPKHCALEVTEEGFTGPRGPAEVEKFWSSIRQALWIHEDELCSPQSSPKASDSPMVCLVKENKGTVRPETVRFPFMNHDVAGNVRSVENVPSYMIESLPPIEMPRYHESPALRAQYLAHSPAISSVPSSSTKSSSAGPTSFWPLCPSIESVPMLDFRSTAGPRDCLQSSSRSTSLEQANSVNNAGHAPMHPFSSWLTKRQKSSLQSVSSHHDKLVDGADFTPTRPSPSASVSMSASGKDSRSLRRMTTEEKMSEIDEFLGVGADARAQISTNPDKTSSSSRKVESGCPDENGASTSRSRKSKKGQHKDDRTTKSDFKQQDGLNDPVAKISHFREMRTELDRMLDKIKI